jgi:hypothetical protein
MEIEFYDFDSVIESMLDEIKEVKVGQKVMNSKFEAMNSKFEELRNEIRQKSEADKPTEQNTSPDAEGTKKHVFAKWMVVAWILLVLIPAGIFYLLWAPERNASQILNAAYKFSSMPEIIVADALMVWDQDKSAIRRFKRLLRDMEKYHDLKAVFRAMNGNQVGWKVVDHLSIEPNWPDTGRVIIVHYINGQGLYRNAIVDSNGNMRIFPGEKRKYYNSFQSIQKAKVLDGI